MEVCTSPLLIVAEYEALPAGDRGSTVLYDEAVAIIEAATATAAAAVFGDDLVQCTADDLAMFSHHVSRLVPRGFTDDAFALWKRAKRSAPIVARLLMSKDFLDDVAAAAASLATPQHERESYAEAGIRAGAAARARFMLAVAAQLAEAGGELAVEARAYLDVLAMRGRLDAARQRHEVAAQAAADQAERQRVAAQEAADAELDRVEGERELDRVLVSRRLPAGLRQGEFAVAELERCTLLATARRRLNSTQADGIRVALGGGQRVLYGARSLAGGIAECSALQLRAVLDALDRAEGRPGATS